jgi:hypothetical protein
MMDRRSSRSASLPRRAPFLAALAALSLFGLAACSDLTGVGRNDIEILWPRNGATLHDEEVLRARVPGRNVEDYDIWWYVDDSRERLMWDEYDDRRGVKAYLVDTWFWNWNGRGPHTIGFIAEDRYGREIAHRTIRVYVE